MRQNFDADSDADPETENHGSKHFMHHRVRQEACEGLL
jgi:hypothetical protein